MDVPHITIRFGQLLDTRGPAVEFGGWRFVPAQVELEGYDAGCEFENDPASVGIAYPRDADASFVRARIPRVFGYTPVYDDSNEKCLLWEGFVAVSEGLSEGIPFICTDYYGKSKLYFSETGPQANVQHTIASAFWRLIAQDPYELEDFEQGVIHLGACCMMYFGCKNGEPFYREDQ